MSNTIHEYLDAEIGRKLSEAADIASSAEKNGRGINEQEQAKADSLLADAAGLKTRLQEMKANESLRDRINEMSGPVVETAEQVAGAKNVGEAFSHSEGYKAFKSAGGAKGQFSFSVEVPFGAKTTVTETASPITIVDTQPTIVGLPTWPTRVADLFAQGATNGPTVRYIAEATETNAAAGVAEAGTKPESVITFVNVDATVGKIATILPVSDEMLDDVAQMESFLNNRLALFVQRQEDSDLLNGAGSPTVTGVLQLGSIQTGSALSLDTDSAIDAIFKAMTAVQVTGLYAPDGIVMHPNDWAAIRLMKSTSMYYGAGPFTAPQASGSGGASNDLWGLPVVTTTSIAAGTALVGAFKTAAQIFRRQGLTVQTTNSHSDYFAKDLTTFRAEIREALVVYRQQAFYKLTGIDQLEGS